ncbi:MAG: nickel-dependent hydrogenase large subunit [Promethearchaeota archaeon]
MAKTPTVMTIPLGPQHPALKEPENFTITLDGEIVVDVEARIGYVHRGIEKAFESRTYSQNVYLAERICGICSQSHTTCYVQAVEEILDLDVPKRGLYIRGIMNELNRIHSHILWLGVAGHEIGWDTLFHYSWRDRELSMDIIEEICGNRVNYANNVIGGVRQDVEKSQIPGMVKRLETIRERIQHYINLILNDQAILDRAIGVGRLETAVGRALCATGPTARASDINWDVRNTQPRTPYKESEGKYWETRVSDMCDVAGRVVVRMLETIDACNCVIHWLNTLPTGDIAARAPRRVPPGHALSTFEAPRGEVLHYVVSNGTDKPERHKARAPTLGNIPSVIEILKGGKIADIPIALASIDPCFSCTDRIILIDEKNNKEVKSWDWFQKVSRETREKEKAWRS